MIEFLKTCGFLILLAVSSTPVGGEESPILVKLPAAGENGVRYEVLVFDRVTQTNGLTYRVDPGWSMTMSIDRGSDLLKAAPREFKFVEVGKDRDAPLSIPKLIIKKFEYWEELALAESRRLIEERLLDEAQQVLEKLNGFNPAWQPEQQQELLNKIKYQRALKLFADLSDEANVQNGIALLEEIAAGGGAAGHLAGFRETYERIYLEFAGHARKEQAYDAMRRALKQIRDRFPESQKLREFEAGVMKQAEEVMLQSETAARNKVAMTAIDLAIQAQQISGGEASIVNRALAVLRNFQRLRLACYEAPGSLDPFNGIQTVDRQVLPLLFDRLVEPGKGAGKEYYAGPLLESFRALDGWREEADGAHSTVWEAILKPGIEFSDGTPVSAGDVANTIELLRDHRHPAHDPEWARMVHGVEVTGARSLHIRTRQFASPESLLAFPITPARHLVNIPRPGDPFARNPIGTGPFVVGPRSQDPQVALEMSVNPRYHGAVDGRPFLKQIQFRFYAKRGTGQATDDMERNEIELISDPSPLQLLRLQSGSGQFDTQPYLSDSVWILAINHRRPVFRNPLTRLGMVHAIDRQGILTRWFTAGGLSGTGAPQAGGPTHRVATGPFPPHSPAYDPGIPVRPFDPVLAQKQIGTAGGAPLTLKYANTGDLQLERAMLEIARNLSAAGLKVQVEPKLPNDFLKEVLEQHDFDLAYYRIDHHNVLHNVAGLFDPDPKELAPGGANFMGYLDQPLTQMFVDLRREQQVDRIWSIQHRIHGYFHNQVVFIPLWRLDSSVVYTRRLSGRGPQGEIEALPIDRRQLFQSVERWYVEPAF